MKQSIIAERIGAAAFIPIMQDGRLTGKFMAYHRVPHCFSEPEIATSLALARILDFSLSRLAGEETRRTAERDAQQLAAIVESSDDVIVSKNLDGVIQSWNDGAERLFGYPKEEALGSRSPCLYLPTGRTRSQKF